MKQYQNEMVRANSQIQVSQYNFGFDKRHAKFKSGNFLKNDSKVSHRNSQRTLKRIREKYKNCK